MSDPVTRKPRAQQAGQSLHTHAANTDEVGVPKALLQRHGRRLPAFLLAEWRATPIRMPTPAIFHSRDEPP